MPAIVEISGRLTPGLWDYNSLDLGVRFPPVELERVATVEGDGFDVHGIRLNTLSGTYTETAAHMIAGTPTVDTLELGELIRPAKLLRLPDVGPRGVVEPEQLEAADLQLDPGDALLVDTGWGPRWDQPGYVTDAPAFSVRTLSWFLEQPFSILGLDTPVMECQWCAEDGRPADAGELLRPLYERGMVLLAPLVNLDRIETPEGTLITMPLRIEGVSAAPCRAAFVEGVDWAHDLADPPIHREERS
jgi:arylformamidase